MLKIIILILLLIFIVDIWMNDAQILSRFNLESDSLLIGFRIFLFVVSVWLTYILVGTMINYFSGMKSPTDKEKENEKEKERKEEWEDEK
ncbi:MAG: hypothetical protein PHR06_10765 [Candidatus Cloacimonetes bacterium]|nr:hypothetical protein [Candidatus Cloacimonadota bacterium]